MKNVGFVDMINSNLSLGDEFVFTNFEKAELIGFKPVSFQIPATIIPVFSFFSNEGFHEFAFQVVDNKIDKVIGLRIVKNISAQNLNLVRNSGNDKRSITLGDKQLRGVELESDIIWGDGEDFIQSLTRSLEKGEMSSNPFFARSVARFIKDAKAEEKFAIKCLDKLTDLPTESILRWVANAKFSENILQKLFEKLVILERNSSDMKYDFNRLSTVYESHREINKRVDRNTSKEDYSSSGWNEERTSLLVKLWADGLSASQIARQLGGVTRNAVIGKVHALGLSGRAKPSSPAVKAATARATAARAGRAVPSKPSGVKPSGVKPSGVKPIKMQSNAKIIGRKK